MMKFVLIILVGVAGGSGNVAMTTVDGFPSEASCKVAGFAVKSDFEAIKNLRVTFKCVAAMTVKP